jgi:hypothetical protein
MKIREIFDYFADMNLVIRIWKNEIYVISLQQQLRVLLKPSVQNLCI